MKELKFTFLSGLLLLTSSGFSQELIIQPPIVTPFGCTEFYSLFTGSVTNFSKGTFSTFLFGEVNYTNSSGQSIRLAEVLFRGMPSVDFIPGVSIINSSNFNSIYPNRKITFFDKNLEELISRTKCIPPGQFEVCLSLYTEKGVVVTKPTGDFLSQTCYTASKELLSTLFLVSPYDESEIQIALPLFTWTPIIPYYEIGAYRLQIVELLDQQSAWDAFQSNPIFFEQDRLKTNILQYPIASRSFEKCKQFAWRVSYSLDRGFGGTTFNKAPAIYQESEIWTFKTACVNSEESAKRINSEPVTPIYFKTSLTNAGNYHEISNSSTLRFVVDNPYRELPNLSYIIVDDRGTEINLNAEFYNEIIPHDLPDLPLTEFYGENKFIVELPSSIELNKPYVLIINGLKEKQFLRFIRI
ncbi:MAG: hypothetical protein IPN15_10605 [Saprospiraceae bacterium]|nr:hypothetical protein [Candidatus Vicinibacter affinis]